MTRNTAFSIRGIHDYLPDEIILWQTIEHTIINILTSYCYCEIRLPILERTELFLTSIGNNTDIVSKEMYSFKDRNSNSLTLRPEATVSCIRASIENKLLEKKEQRLWYIGPMFRYERPQKGRFRQFYQLGAEVLGLSGPDIDLEVILLTARFWKILGISDFLTLELNSIGSFKSRKKYETDLVIFLKKYQHLLDKDSNRRLLTNPLRILDSKNVVIKKLLLHAPNLNTYLDDHDADHFKKLCSMINKFGIHYSINYNLVRGLDYYNNTVFEWTSKKLKSAQNTVCAGGRYDGLVQLLGGRSTPAIGFAIGIERLVLLINSLKKCKNLYINVDVYIIFLKDIMKVDAIKLGENIRNILPKLKTKINFFSGNIIKKLQMANKEKVKVVLLLAQNELDKKCIIMKDLKKRTQKTILIKNVIQELKNFFT